MTSDPLIAIALLVFVAIAIADIYFDVLYQGLGRRLLLLVSSGRFPPTAPTRVQRLVTSVAGLAVVLAFLLAILLVSKLVE
jgi:hypothetical protein